MSRTSGNDDAPRTVRRAEGTRGRRRKAWPIIGALLAAGLLGGCGSLMMLFHHQMDFEVGSRPADEAEYGFGPRVSRGGIYRVSAEPVPAIRVGRMHGMRVQVETADGRPVDAATILVDGGMPEHGHGLPTHPQMTASLGGGAYEVEGVKYNMGGWWVVRMRIESEMGADEVLFNLNL